MKVDTTFISKKERKICFNIIDISHIDVNTKTNININVLDFKILSLSLNIGVDTIVPEPDFTIEKYWKDGHYRGHHVVNKWKICDDKIGHVEGWET